MAAVTLLGSTYTTTAGAKTVTATPAVDDLIVLAIAHTGDSSWSNPTDNNSDDLGTYTIVGSITSNINDGVSAIGIYVRDAAIGSASSTVFTAPDPGTDTGGGLFVLKITGMSRYGIGAVRQYKYASTSSGGAGTTGTWTSAKLTGNPVIGVLGDTLGSAAAPTSGYTELFDANYSTPFCRVEVQSRNSGDTSSSMLWTGAAGTSMTGEVLGVEFNASTLLTLTAPTLGLTPQNIAQNRTQNLTAAALTLTPNSVTALWTIRPATADFTFNREVFQITTVNNQSVSTFDFVQPDINVGASWSLTAAAVGFVANDLQLAITNNLDVGNLILAGQDTQQVASTTLGTTTMDFVDGDITEVQVVALDATALNFTAQTSNPVAVVTLSTAVMDMVVLDIRPENLPLGTVQVMTIAAMNFVVNDIGNTASTTLSAAAMNDVAYDLHLLSGNVLTAPTFDLAPQPLTVTQAAVVVALVPATFDFVPSAIQAAGTSSVGDRRRIMMGVGK